MAFSRMECLMLLGCTAVVFGQVKKITPPTSVVEVFDRSVDGPELATLAMAEKMPESLYTFVPMLGEFKGDKDTYKSAKNEKLNVQMYGNNVAVVTGRARETGTGKDGKAFDRTFLFTDTWMMRGGKWQCISSQVARIKG